MPYIILVGMMGSGKSTVGRLLAEDLDVAFLDTDMLIQHKIGRSISQIFSLYGEEAFRHYETAALQSISEDGEGVVATGGGIILSPDNWEEFRRIGKTVFLDTHTDTLTTRLRESKRKRPLLETENWEKRLKDILDERRPIYEMSDFKVNIHEESFPDVVEMIKEVLS